MIDSAIVFIVSFLEKRAAFIIWMNHKDFSPLHSVFLGLFQSFFQDFSNADVVTDMTSQFFNMFHFIWLEGDFSVLLTAGSTLIAFMENCVEPVGVEWDMFCHLSASIRSRMHGEDGL